MAKKQRIPKAVKEAREHYFQAVTALAFIGTVIDSDTKAEIQLNAKTAEINLINAIGKALDNAFKRGQREGVNSVYRGSWDLHS